MPDASSKSTTLDYAMATRSKKLNLSVVAATLGILIGVFGAVMLFYGVMGVVWVIHDWHRVDGGDIFEVGMFTLIGAFCAVMSVRWIRSAFGYSGRSGGK